MAERPVPVAVCAVVTRKRILLIRRSTGNFKGFWALPGGKIEFREHLSASAVREVKEETGIDSEFVSLIGLISEHLVEGGEVTEHFILNFCELRPNSTKITESDAGEVKWFSLGGLDDIKGKLVPSDYEMITRMLLNKEGKYFDSVMEKKNKGLILEKFEFLS